MAIQRFHIALFGVAAAALTVLLTDPALAQSFPSNTDHSRDDPDAYAQGWRRTSYEPVAAQPAAERSTASRPDRREGAAKRDFVSELLGPAAEEMRRMPSDLRPEKPRRTRNSSGGAGAPVSLSANRTPDGQDPSLIFE